MKLNISEINDSHPILILYSSGTGGEFLTKTIESNTPGFVKGQSFLNTERNQTHYETLLDYSANWGDVNNPDSWIKNPSLTGDGRYIFRDHPSVFFAKYYWKYFPNISVIHLVVKREFEYFAKLTFKKLARRIESRTVDRNFILTRVNDKCSDANIEKLIHWAKSYEWIWLHELLTANTFLSENGNINNYEHYDSIAIYEAKQAESIAYQSNVLPTYLSQIFDEYRIIDIDSLIDNSEYFCNNIKNLLPLFDAGAAINQIEEWIANNNLLIKNGTLNE
jgi:hypothetical protein